MNAAMPSRVAELEAQLERSEIARRTVVDVLVDTLVVRRNLEQQLESLRARNEQMHTAWNDLAHDAATLITANRRMAKDNANIVARLAELADQNQLLLDDAADQPVPFTITPAPLLDSPGADVLPMQRPAGEQS